MGKFLLAEVLGKSLLGRS